MQNDAILVARREMFSLINIGEAKSDICGFLVRLLNVTCEPKFRSLESRSALESLCEEHRHHVIGSVTARIERGAKSDRVNASA